ncbi:MAG: ATP synthase F1 subunit delta [Alphaproteobacteria bacterium]|nr:ATP synthase F1 subunit delta [Alphaproteobacteria bacterium]
MSEEQVARVYAQALFDAAGEAGVVVPVRRELDDFVAALAASAPLRGVLADPRVAASAKRSVLAEVLRDGQPLLTNTLQLMLERGRFAALVELQRAYEALAAVDQGTVAVEVVSATELPSETQEKISAQILAATGRRVEMTRRVDPEILGGLVLRIGDVIVDGSVKTRIRQLRRRLATAEVRGDVQ